MKPSLVRLSAVLYLCLGFGVTSCKSKRSDESPAALRPDDASWKLSDPSTKDRWVQKLSRKVRGGVEPTADQLSRWREQTPDQVYDDMVKTPEFDTGVLDFMLFFLGFKDDKLVFGDGTNNTLASYFDPTVNRSIISITPAIQGARSFLAGDDFISALATLSGPFYVAPLPRVKIDDGGQGLDFMAQLRTVVANHAKSAELLHSMQTAGKLDPKICKIWSTEGVNDPFTRLLDPVIYQIGSFPFQFLRANLKCDAIEAAGEHPADDLLKLPDNFPSVVSGIDRMNDVLKAYMAEFDTETYKPKTVRDLKTFSFPGIDFGLQFGNAPGSDDLSKLWFWGRQVNSSTNRNRKRAAYVLKRFFCDDLTPIGVETPASHADDQHASDASCASCHYKLDPMAGFFRKIGRNGVSYKDQQYIMFDDFAVNRSSDYFKSWNDSNGVSQTGYIRSRTDLSLNQYSANLSDPEFEDLAAIIRTAPEVKTCVIKRAFQYLVGEEVALDGGFLKELETVYSSEPSQTSTEALKKVFKRISVTYSFVSDTSERGVCYDYAVGYNAADKPACEINYIVETSCANTCHSKSVAAGGLNMASWTKPVALNAIGGFSHVNEQTNQPLTYGESLERMIGRLSTTDDAKRMPLKMSMNPLDREALFLWLSNEQRTLK